jgi:hypothetical protein
MYNNSNSKDKQHAKDNSGPKPDRNSAKPKNVKQMRKTKTSYSK